MPLKIFTDKEAKAMKGVEFIFSDNAGRDIKAYIAEVDLKVGLTCLSLGSLPETDACYPIKEGAELICVNISLHSNASGIHKRLEAIKKTGRWKSPASSTSIMQPCAFLQT